MELSLKINSLKYYKEQLIFEIKEKNQDFFLIS
jgi:hypothetical protein